MPGGRDARALFLFLTAVATGAGVRVAGATLCDVLSPFHKADAAYEGGGSRAFCGVVLDAGGRQLRSVHHVSAAVVAAHAGVDDLNQVIVVERNARADDNDAVVGPQITTYFVDPIVESMVRVGRGEADMAAHAAVLRANRFKLLSFERTVQPDDLTHGAVIFNEAPGVTWLFASSDREVVRYRFTPGRESARGGTALVDRAVVVTGINAAGNGGAPRGHWTRTLVVHRGWMYIQVGSDGNVDANSYRSRIRKVRVGALLPSGAAGDLPLDYTTLEIFADGLRNEVGLGIDPSGTAMWGVENGADNLFRDDLGGRIVNDNPAEEVNRFPIPADDDGNASPTSRAPHYGYPFCFSEYSNIVPRGALAGALHHPGTVWAWPGKSVTATPFARRRPAATGADAPWTDADGSGAGVPGGGSVSTDAWCRAETVPSVVPMPAHSAPLGFAFSTGRTARDATSFTQSGGLAGRGASVEAETYAHDMFVAFHGSWNRDPPTGYKLVRIPMRCDATACAPDTLTLGEVAAATGRAAWATDANALVHESTDGRERTTYMHVRGGGGVVAMHDVMYRAGSGVSGGGGGALTPRWADGFRPVDAAFDAHGRLLLTSDGSRGGSGALVLVMRNYTVAPPTPAPTPTPPTDAPTSPPSSPAPQTTESPAPAVLQTGAPTPPPTPAPATDAPTVPTEAPTPPPTPVPFTDAPTQPPPTPTDAPTLAPSPAPPTDAPTAATDTPTPTAASTAAPVPETEAPASTAPVAATAPPTAAPTTGAPTTGRPTTGRPSTGRPSTGEPTTGEPNTARPTTGNPTTGEPTTGAPTTGVPGTLTPAVTSGRGFDGLQVGTVNPTTGAPTTGEPTTGRPTTGEPVTAEPSTGRPTTGRPTTGEPTTGQPTTGRPTTGGPGTAVPTDATETVSTSASASDTDDDDDLSNGAIAGIVIGSVVVLSLVAAVALQGARQQVGEGEAAQRTYPERPTPSPP